MPIIKVNKTFKKDQAFRVLVTHEVQNPIKAKIREVPRLRGFMLREKATKEGTEISISSSEKEEIMNIEHLSLHEHWMFVMGSLFYQEEKWCYYSECIFVIEGDWTSVMVPD